MPIQLYVWHSDKDDKEVYNHVSLGMSDGTYISWWGHVKDFSVVNKRKDGKSKSLKDDIDLQSSHYPKTYSLSNINEEKVKAWWGQFGTSPMKAFEKELNGSTVVLMALCEGHDFFKSFRRTSLTPEEMLELAKQYMEEQQLKDKKPPVKKFTWF